MRRTWRVYAILGLLLAWTPGLALAVAQEPAKAGVRQAAGTITAVTPASRTIVVEATLGGKGLTIGAEVPETAAIKAEGRPRRLDELKPGDRVVLRWVREENRLVAESITVAGPKKP